MSELTKWPRLLVAGDPVTEQQANDILIRTNFWHHLMSNDQAWQQQVEAAASVILGRPIEPDMRARDETEAAARMSALNTYWEKLKAWHDDAGVLDLTFLHNERIMSSWIGGPHGWCDWDGTIGCSTWNIGKWPTREAVAEDWSLIASAWPFLTLTAQLVADEGDGEVAAEWRVSGGSVSEVEPGSPVVDPTEVSEVHMLGRFLLPGGERGVSPERLREALQQVADQRLAVTAVEQDGDARG